VSSPTFAGHNAFMRAGLGSWMISGTGRWQDGQRLTPSATDSLGVGGKAMYAGFPVVYPHSHQYWWDPINPGHVVNFYDPAPGQIGNVPNGIIAGPDYSDVDLSLRKTFNYSERYHLTVNIDSFNILNHPNFESPSVNVDTQVPLTVTNGAASSATEDHSSLGISSAFRGRQIQGGLRFAF